MALFDFLIGKKKDPYQAAQPYLNQAMQTSQQGYAPYEQYGLGAGANLSQQYGDLASDPGGYLEKLMSGYKESAGAKIGRQEALNAAGASAAAGGRSGTIEDISNQAQLSDRLSQQDMQQYLQNVSGLMGQGLQGQQNLYGQGLSATGARVGDVSNIYGQQAGLAFNDAQNQNSQQLQLLKALMQGGGAALGAFLAPGVGQAAGGAAGGKFAEWLSK